MTPTEYKVNKKSVTRENQIRTKYALIVAKWIRFSINRTVCLAEEHINRSGFVGPQFAKITE
jgi:hypothetical protein